MYESTVIDARRTIGFGQLPDQFQDWYLRISGKKNVGDTLYTHLNREMFQAQWKILLDDEFVHAYQHGIVVDSFDGVRRRFYPRVLTYSADYPERYVHTESGVSMKHSRMFPERRL